MQEYIEKNKNIQQLLVDFIDNSNISLHQTLNDFILHNDKNELTLFFNLLVKISNNHYRNASFFSRIDQILQILANKIKQTYSNLEIFKIFKSNKRILHFLIVQKILIPDESFKNLPEEFKIIFETNEFDDRINSGESQGEICRIIREDSIKEFIKLVDIPNINFSNKILITKEDTNEFLQTKKSVSFLEYAAFFGSIKIFHYLVFQNLELTKSLWYFAIHSGNAKIIHFLEDKNILPDKKMSQQLYFESIKCHNHSVTEYIYKNYIEDCPDDNDYNNYSIYFKYYNYRYLPDDACSNIFLFFACCETNNPIMFQMFKDKTKFNVNQRMIKVKNDKGKITN